MKWLSLCDECGNFCEDLEECCGEPVCKLVPLEALQSARERERELIGLLQEAITCNLLSPHLRELAEAAIAAFDAREKGQG